MWPTPEPHCGLSDRECRFIARLIALVVFNGLAGKALILAE